MVKYGTQPELSLMQDDLTGLDTGDVQDVIDNGFSETCSILR